VAKDKKAAREQLALTARRTAKKIAKAVLDKNAAAVKILDVTGLVSYTDYMVICQAQSDRQARAIADHIELTMKSEGMKPFITEGYEHGSWVLLDYSDVILHIFLPDVREFYDLDGLWTDAREVSADEPDDVVSSPVPAGKPARRIRATKGAVGKKVKAPSPGKKPARKIPMRGSAKKAAAAGRPAPKRRTK
jgi:ribosome-associated protein